MRELDELLVAYLDKFYESASETDKRAFQALLDLPDPELAGYLLNQQTPSPELKRVIDQILGRADA
ncbi:MAG: succinate dehydrogenase assembly factor 2 [Woeseiaceae bacterium]|nr:succinate dehydrogenase assembly factor 2 [Woeseiaceae bacterium]NIP19681.1 succinate dehydrogenase assembly factor 2 [Woeseiaceae bacterium]NIS89798.1 succinate dehydrogenase assembly factor 2 [Woeseiaceae bacterium]